MLTFKLNNELKTFNKRFATTEKNLLSQLKNYE